MLERAEAIALDNRSVCLQRGWAGHVSHCDVVLGLCAAERAPSIAAQRLIEARRWAHQSGEVEAQLRCFELDLRLQTTAERRNRVLDDALSLASSSGFGRFARRLSALS